MGYNTRYTCQYSAFKPGIHTVKCLEIFEWSSNSIDNDIPWISLEAGDLKDYFGAASFVTLTRLIISPMIAILMVYILGLHGLEGTVTVVEAGMPSAMLSLSSCSKL